MASTSNINLNDIKTKKLTLNESLKKDSLIKGELHKNIGEIESKVNDIETMLFSININQLPKVRTYFLTDTFVEFRISIISFQSD